MNGKTGYLCHPFDVDAFAKGIEKLSDSETRESMKLNCKEIVKQFDIRVSVEQRKEIYNQVLK